MTQPAPSTSTPAAAPPPSADTLVRTIGGLAARLADLMIKETAFALAGRLAELVPLQQEKADLTRAYIGRWAQLKADRAGFAALPADLRQALRLQVERLDAAAAENEAGLRRMRNATDRVLGIIARGVREQTAVTAGYRNPRDPTKQVPNALGLAINRSL